jgi:acyl-CoA reductase-like NAD-dependent aldehyde dehydrogenase
MGDPRKQETTLGPVVSKASAEHIRKQIADAVSKGAKSLVPSEKHAHIAKEGTTYVAPQVLVGVDHSMSIMKDETLYASSYLGTDLLVLT